ncbi:ABC transporter G family member 11 [Hondaea fermentalgiana]|uniref:ABC transporter G family member 11 n=1 Tax=Hondaea fermentalgiana TaxID=2315210 RepID=A0A2R5GV97_9STRA|nr:ABC transporter G family member 11 [Hondaea fermentalgiana]|eukprot:GBG32321.1 ABC transporter G family member 11 [Hondaea fermentalgiana]
MLTADGDNTSKVVHEGDISPTQQEGRPASTASSASSEADDDDAASEASLHLNRDEDPEDGLTVKCEPHSLVWRDVSVTVQAVSRENGKKKRQDKVIVDKSSGIVKPGELLAIMGPSGSGKTTCLDVLAGRTASSKLSGEVFYGGRKLSQRQRQRILSYVAQEDTLMGQFTVRETLEFAARFHYGFSVTKAELAVLVNEAMDEMGLTHVQDTLVGDIFRKGLSGGQKRRLSIAVELLSHPAIVLLDEPTSGLDSASSFAVIKRLRGLTRRMHTVVTTIHQPSSEVWAMFDKFMLMSRGQTLYLGTAKGAVGYFGTLGYVCPSYCNPADFLISIVNTDFKEFTVRADPLELANHYTSSSLHTETKAQIESTLTSGDQGIQHAVAPRVEKSCPMMSDFLFLSRRNLLNNLRNPGIYWVRFVMYVGLCLMIGLMYLGLGDEFTATSINSRTASLFYVAAFLVFMSVAVLPFIVEERATFVRERANGMYSPIAYVVSHYFCMIPGIFLISLVSTASVVPLAGMNGFGNFLAALFVSLLTAESMVFFVGSISPHYIIGIALAAGMNGMMMLASGFLIVASDIPDYLIWLHYIGFHTYELRSFFYNEFSPIEHFDSTQFPSGEAVLEFFDMEDVNIAHDLTIVWAFGFFFQICFGLSLYFLHRGKR